MASERHRGEGVWTTAATAAACLLAGWLGGSGALRPQSAAAAPTVPASSGDGHLHSSIVRIGDQHSQLVVVDQFKKTAAVYHIDPASGKIGLKSVRNLYWDLEMLTLNSEDPQPAQIRQMMQQR